MDPHPKLHLQICRALGKNEYIWANDPIIPKPEWSGDFGDTSLTKLPPFGVTNRREKVVIIIPGQTIVANQPNHPNVYPPQK